MAEAVRTPASYDQIDEAEGMKVLDVQSRKYLKMSGAEFARRYEAGQIEDSESSEVIRVAMLLPFTKQAKNGRKNRI